MTLALTPTPVDIGGRTLTLTSQGSGTPTIILESGRGLDSRLWRRLLPEIATLSRVCAYDRAGLGGSDPVPQPRWFDAIADDLAALIRTATLPPPYLFVAHSVSACWVRLFAARYPADIAGLVFLDPWTDDQYPRLKESLSPVAYAEMLERTPGLIPTEVFGTGRALDAAEDWAPIRSARVPDGLPVVVIARGQPDPHPPGGLDTAAWERVHGQLQDGFAHQFPSGVLWVAKKSGHLIPRDEPDIILRAIKSIIEQMPAR